MLCSLKWHQAFNCLVNETRNFEKVAFNMNVFFSKAKTMYNNIWRKDWMDEQTDFEADVWGRALLDINRFRPKGLDPKYWSDTLQ